MSAGVVQTVLQRALARCTQERAQLEERRKVLAHLLRRPEAQLRPEDELLNAILAFYMELGSFTAVAQVCNALGWLARDEKGERPFEPQDIELIVVENEVPGNEALRGLAQARMAAAQRA